MKTKKNEPKLMLSHAQTVSGNEHTENKCDIHFVVKEYSSQPYGTCLICGATVFE